jgi:dihydrofolate reductase
MRKVILSAMSSLDGMFDGPGDGAERIDWFRADQEWFDYSVESLDAADALLFGRRTFDGMAEYWPGQTDPVGVRMNALEKVGFSRSPRETTWTNARMSTDPVGEVSRMREADGGNLLILGSADLAATLTAAGLIDEYRIAVTPTVLGAGTPLFQPGHPRIALRRDDVRLFASGIVELRCTPS